MSFIPLSEQQHCGINKLAQSLRHGKEFESRINFSIESLTY